MDEKKWMLIYRDYLFLERCKFFKSIFPTHAAHHTTATLDHTLAFYFRRLEAKKKTNAFLFSFFVPTTKEIFRFSKKNEEKSLPFRKKKIFSFPFPLPFFYYQTTPLYKRPRAQFFFFFSPYHIFLIPSSPPTRK